MILGETEYTGYRTAAGWSAAEVATIADGKPIDKETASAHGVKLKPEEVTKQGEVFV